MKEQKDLSNHTLKQQAGDKGQQSLPFLLPSIWPLSLQWLLTFPRPTPTLPNYSSLHPPVPQASSTGFVSPIDRLITTHHPLFCAITLWPVAEKKGGGGGGGEKKQRMSQDLIALNICTGEDHPAVTNCCDTACEIHTKHCKQISGPVCGRPVECIVISGNGTFCKTRHGV